MDLEGELAGPDEALNRELFRAARAPAAVGAADEEGAILALPHRDHAGAETLLEGEACALVTALHLLQEDTHDCTVRLIADEELLLEGAELAAGQVALDAAGGLAHLAVGEDDRRRDQLWDALRLGHDPAAALGNE